MKSWRDSLPPDWKPPETMQASKSLECLASCFDYAIQTGQDIYFEPGLGASSVLRFKERKQPKPRKEATHSYAPQRGIDSPVSEYLRRIIPYLRTD